MKKAIYILFLIVFQQLGFSQLQMPDTTLFRGDRAILQLSLGEEIRFTSDSNAINFNLKYDLNMIEIISISTLEPIDGIGFTANNILSTDGSYLEFNGALNQEEKFIAEIEIEALAGPDSLTYFVVDSLNGESYTFDNQISRVSITDPIFKSNFNTVGEPYPNPFDRELFLDIIIEETTTIEAKIFNYAGRLIALEDRILGVKMFLYDDMNNKIEFGIVEPGEYKIRAEIDNSKLANGYYYLGVNLGGELIYKPIVMTNW
jgi:hypothetical protein